MDALLYSEVNLLCAAILSIIALKSSVFSMTKNQKHNLFIYSVWFAAAANLFDAAWKMGLTGYWYLPVSVMIFVNFMYFICFGFSAYFWFLYSEATAKSKIFENNKLIMLTALPLILLAVLLLASIFTGCLFYFDGDMVYHRGPLYYMQQILSYGYIVVACVKNLIMAGKKQNYARRDEMLTVATFAVPPLLCCIVQTVLQDIPLVTMGVVIAYLLVYINTLLMLISVDMVTGINNRREFLKKLEEQISFLKKDEKLYFLFIDIDSFKQINDIYGHNEGDRALRTVAAVLKEICAKTNGFCARYGGDEFAIAQVLKNDEDVTVIRKNIYDLVDKKSEEEALAYTLSISIGCAEYTEETESMQDLISYADSNMYDKKMQKKQRRELFSS